MLKYILVMAFSVLAAFWLLIGVVELGSFVGASLPSIPRWVGFSAYMAFLGGTNRLLALVAWSSFSFSPSLKESSHGTL